MSKTDIDLTKVKAVVFDVDGVLSPSTVPMDSRGIPMRMVNIKDGYALQHAAKCGLPMAIITGCTQESIKHRYNALGIKDVFIGASSKINILQQWLDKQGLTAQNVMFVGDDIPDFECMHHVAFPVAPHDAAPEIRNIARYVTTANGGYGVAREILEQILKARGQWANSAQAFGW